MIGIEQLLSEWDTAAEPPQLEAECRGEIEDDYSDGEAAGEAENGDDAVWNAGEVPDHASAAGRAYLNVLKKGGGITLLQEDKVTRAYHTKGILGLFGLFFNRRIRDTLLQWLNPRLTESGVPTITLRELNAYIGLEIATSLCPLNRLRDYWSTNELYGHQLFRSTMQRDLFLGIRAALTLHPVDTVPKEVKVRDPLWHCRSILNNILKKCAT
ncbi:hypothetical protein DVH05_004076 [Phytophthora capsici]|nr:hypothetical protein DVH05_004076 [Phytophthora capsici]